MGRIVVLLLVANLAWASWSMGWLRGLGIGPADESEPQRLQRQVKPEALTVIPAQDEGSIPPRRSENMARTPQAPTSTPTPAAAPEPFVCLQAGTFDEKQMNALRQATARLPPGSWRIEQQQQRGRWMVYLGKLPDDLSIAAKRAELRQWGVETDRAGASFEPGLSLGRFSSEEAAHRQLEALQQKGIAGIRVVQDRPSTSVYLLRLPKASPALRKQAEAVLGPALSGRTLRQCD